MESEDTYNLPMPTEQHESRATGYGDNQPRILCVECGVSILSNPTAMCVDCLRTKVDITEGIPKQGVVYFCKGCERYLRPPGTWIRADLESKELLTLCLKRLKGLGKVRLVDAGFVWTEPHSRRIKVKCTVQSEVQANAIMEQTFVVEFVVHTQMCDDCHRTEAKDTWNCVVQLRQKVKHKKTFYYIEQLIVKHRAHRDTINISQRSDGVDFYFATKSHGKRMVDFLSGCAPIRCKQSERLISQDVHTSSYNYKFTFSVEIAPICRQDVVVMHPQIARKHGNISPLLLCDRVGTTLHFVDPCTLQSAEVTSSAFWARPFTSVCDHTTLTEFMVLDIEPVHRGSRDGGALGRNSSQQYKLVECTIARMRDLGYNDTTFTVFTHLGHILNQGDLVWGFDLDTANINDEHANKLDLSKLQEVILVKKSYSERRKERRRRHWKLQTMNAEHDDGMTAREIESGEKDFEGFMQDVEEDPELRSTLNIYRDSKVTEIHEEDPDLDIRLEEMLDDFDAMDLGDLGRADNANSSSAAAEQVHLEDSELSLSGPGSVPNAKRRPTSPE